MILDEPLDDWMIEKLNSRLKVWKVSWRPRLTKMEAMCNTSTIAFIQQSWNEKKGGEKSSDSFLGCFLFSVRIFATKAPYPKCPPSVKHWAGRHGFQCLPAILCSEDPVGQTPQAPKWKRPTYASTTNINSRDTPRSKDSQGLWYLWLKYLGCERFNCFRSSLRNPTFAMGCLM